MCFMQLKKHSAFVYCNKQTATRVRYVLLTPPEASGVVFQSYANAENGANVSSVFLQIVYSWMSC